MSASVAKPEPNDHHAFADDSSVKIVSSFDAMDISAELLRGIYSYGFEKPSAIQQRAIVPFIQGGDLIAQAQSGTGKTGAFTIGLLQRMDWNKAVPQGLVLSPTRELAMQTAEVISKVGTHMIKEGKFCSFFVGGTSVKNDLRVLSDGILVAVGTPGRIFDVISRKALLTDELTVLVLDEADEMLSQGFSVQIYEIFKFLPHKIQVTLFSATMPTEVLDLTQKFMRNPVRILVKNETLTLEGIMQFYVAVEEDYKLETLMDLYSSISIAQSVIFCNTKARVSSLAEEMIKEKYPVSQMHADIHKSEREATMKNFKNGSSRVLITTDLLARGIDIQQVSIVINYDLPTSQESYLHRIGRSGRYGRKGVAINFVNVSDVPVLKDLQKFYHIIINELPENFIQLLN